MPAPCSAKAAIHSDVLSWYSQMRYGPNWYAHESERVANCLCCVLWLSESLLQVLSGSAWSLSYPYRLRFFGFVILDHVAPILLGFGQSYNSNNCMQAIGAGDQEFSCSSYNISLQIPFWFASNFSAFDSFSSDCSVDRVSQLDSVLALLKKDWTTL